MTAKQHPGRPKRTSQRFNQTNPNIMATERIIDDEVLVVTGEEGAPGRRNTELARISARKYNSLSVQNVRDMCADKLYRAAPSIAERVASYALGECEMKSGELKAAELVLRRILPSLQGIAVQHQHVGNVSYSWKDKHKQAINGDNKQTKGDQ